MKALIALFFIASINTTEPVSTTTSSTLPVKESLLLSLERTPCFGKCPTYKYTILTTGKIIYNGSQNTKNIGSYTAQLNKSQLEEIKNQIKILDAFSLQDKYDAKVTDIPSTILVINIDGKKKKIYDRHGAPEKLKQFEKFVDKIVLNTKMTKTKDQSNGNRD